MYQTSCSICHASSWKRHICSEVWWKPVEDDSHFFGDDRVAIWNTMIQLFCLFFLFIRAKIFGILVSLQLFKSLNPS